MVVSQTQNGDKVYSNITASAPLQSGQALPAPSVAPLCYGPDRNPQTFAALPEWIRKAITAGGAAPAGAGLGFTPAATYSPPALEAARAQLATIATIAAPAQPMAQTQTAPPTGNPAMPFDDALNF